MPSCTPLANSTGVESAFASASEPFASSNTTTSVNVPPMSTPMRNFSAPPINKVTALAPVPTVANVPVVPKVQAGGQSDVNDLSFLRRLERLKQIGTIGTRRQLYLRQVHRWFAR